MLEFGSEEVRTQFHLLSPEAQKEWNEMALRFAKKGMTIEIQYIEEIVPGQLEACIRIHK